MQLSQTHPRVMIDAVWPAAGFWREGALIVGGCLLIALAAHLQILLPNSPVPVTGQTFAILLLGALYGSRRGPATVVTYLMLGAAGLPVFAGGMAGLARFVGPTAGYLVGFVVAAFTVGWLSERRWDRKPWTTAASMIIGNGIIYALGVVWLWRFVGGEAVLNAGVVPFLPGDALKIALATILLPSGWRIIGRPV
ncbi:MAG: BioY protein [Anaerolineales bacterium]|jgi:biotin transport system substrate-specific component|nr:BioY protein [Anaerolineales bacterium]